MFRRIALWSVLAWGCALPLLGMTWSKFTTAERIAEAGGVVAWTAIMVLVSTRLQGRDSINRMLRDGALAVAALNLLALIVEPMFALAIIYFPAIRLSVPFMKAFDSIAGTGADVANVLTLTLLCGAQAVALAWGLGRLIARARMRVAPAAS